MRTNPTLALVASALCASTAEFSPRWMLVDVERVEPRTAYDLARIDAARRKRERKAARRKSPTAQVGHGGEETTQ